MADLQVIGQVAGYQDAETRLTVTVLEDWRDERGFAPPPVYMFRALPGQAFQGPEGEAATVIGSAVAGQAGPLAEVTYTLLKPGLLPFARTVRRHLFANTEGAGVWDFTLSSEQQQPASSGSSPSVTPTVNVLPGTGPKGEPGASFLTGLGDPSDHTGQPGDTYFNESSGDLFKKGGEGFWQKVTTLKGIQGPPGEPGKPGKDGASFPKPPQNVLNLVPVSDGSQPYGFSWRPLGQLGLGGKSRLQDLQDTAFVQLRAGDVIVYDDKARRFTNASLLALLQGLSGGTGPGGPGSGPGTGGGSAPEKIEQTSPTLKPMGRAETYLRYESLTKFASGTAIGGEGSALLPPLLVPNRRYQFSHLSPANMAFIYEINPAYTQYGDSGLRVYATFPFRLVKLGYGAGESSDSQVIAEVNDQSFNGRGGRYEGYPSPNGLIAIVPMVESFSNYIEEFAVMFYDGVNGGSPMLDPGRWMSATFGRHGVYFINGDTDARFKQFAANQKDISWEIEVNLNSVDDKATVNLMVYDDYSGSGGKIIESREVVTDGPPVLMRFPAIPGTHTSGLEVIASGKVFIYGIHKMPAEVKHADPYLNQLKTMTMPQQTEALANSLTVVTGSGKPQLLYLDNDGKATDLTTPESILLGPGAAPTGQRLPEITLADLNNQEDMGPAYFAGFMPEKEVTLLGLTCWVPHNGSVRMAVYAADPEQEQMTLLGSSEYVPYEEQTSPYPVKLKSPVKLKPEQPYLIGLESNDGSVLTVKGSGIHFKDMGYMGGLAFSASGPSAPPQMPPLEGPYAPPFSLLATVSTPKQVVGPLDPTDSPVTSTLEDLPAGSLALLDNGTDPPRWVRKRADGSVWWGAVMTQEE